MKITGPELKELYRKAKETKRQMEETPLRRKAEEMLDGWGDSFKARAEGGYSFCDCYVGSITPGQLSALREAAEARGLRIVKFNETCVSIQWA